MTPPARPRPVFAPFDVAVAYRIVVDVGDVRAPVRIVTDQMLPEPPLPDAAFAGAAALRGIVGGIDRTREMLLEQPPPVRKGRRRAVQRHAARKASMRSVRSLALRLRSATVKKYVPPRA